MGLLQNLLMRIKADPSNAVQGFNRVEKEAKKMGRSVKEEVSNPLGGAFKHLTGNVKSFVLGLLAVEKTLETIKRLVDRGRSTKDISTRYRISTGKAALINRTANITGLGADEIASKIGLEEKPLTQRELRAVLSAVAKQNPFSVAAEAKLAQGTFSADNVGRRALEASSKFALDSRSGAYTPGVTYSAFGRLNTSGVTQNLKPSTIPRDVRRDAVALGYEKDRSLLIKEIQDIRKNTEETARAAKQEVTF